MNENGFSHQERMARRRQPALHWFGAAAAYLSLAAGGDDGSFLLELTEGNFDVLLRAVPVALVVYCNPTTELHYPSLLPTLHRLAAAYEHAGIGVGRVPSQYVELLDRFQVDSFPTVHWMDGSRKWPYYASEAFPERYSGPRGFEALAGFVEAKTGIPPRLPAEEPAPADGADADEPQPSSGLDDNVHNHDCAARSASYRACLRTSPTGWQHRSCASERHEYLLCMSGSWAVHPDHHERLAGIYAQQFAESH